MWHLLTIHRELPYSSSTASFTTYTSKTLCNPTCSLCLLSKRDHMLEKLAFYHLTGKELQQVSIRNAKGPWTENRFIKFLLITDNGELCRKIKGWRRCVLEAALELKNPDGMVEERPTALNFSVHFRVMQIKDLSRQLCFKGTRTGTADSPWMEAELRGMPRYTEYITGSPVATKTRTN